MNRRNAKLLLLFVVVCTLTACFRQKSPSEPTKEDHLPSCGVRDDGSSMSNAPAVFKAKCAVCHSLTKASTGPALQGFMRKAPSEQ